MPHPNRKQRLGGADDDGKQQDDANFSSLSTDILANIYCCLPLKEIMRSRRVSKKSSDAVKKTSEPIVASIYKYFEVNSVMNYNALAVMAEAMPGLQQVSLGSSKYGEEKFKYIDGEEPDEEEVAHNAEYTALNIVDVLSPANFPNLHALCIDSNAPLNGKYPSLFNFSNLEKLTISRCNTIKFGFDMLAGLRSLKEFECIHNKLATGNLKDLSVCQNTLERIDIVCSDDAPIGGNFMDLANFPNLKSLTLHQTKVTGQLRDIGDDDFPMLEVLKLPSTVVGGNRYEIQRVAQAKELIDELLPLRRKRPELFSDRYFHWKLSDESEDVADPRMDFMPDYHNYCFYFVQAGSRLGWRWEKKFDYTPDNPFEVHWLDPVPNKKSNDYQAYADVAKSFIPNGAGRFFKGLYEPPSYTVLNRLSRNYVPSAEEMEMWENL
eukprot:scaffold5571_cov102-Skeletonema_menzelii.AAC.2